VLPVTALVDHDVELGTAYEPGQVLIGEQVAIGAMGVIGVVVVQLAPVLVVVRTREVVGVVVQLTVVFWQPRGWDMGNVGLAASSGVVRCLAGDGHWPDSLPAASLD
jgi:hypothetical protein